MALRIANNISAMNTQRWLSVADSGMKKSLERLSSGYRINKAADDAAGLAISQSFRANIASFKVASRNTSEANALLQVAEGGMDQIGNMLTRLKELATQASSANAGQSERDKIDAEGEALLSEIDRIANSSKYGSTSLLDGTFGASKADTLGADTTVAKSMIGTSYNYAYFSSAGQTGASVTALGSGVVEGLWTFSGTLASSAITIANSAGTITETYVYSALGTTASFANLGITVAFTAAVSTYTFSAGADDVSFMRTGMADVNTESATTGVYTFSHNGTAIKITNSAGTVSESATYVNGTTALSYSALGISFKLASDYDADDLDGMTLTIADSGSSGSTFQIGAENNTDNRISITIGGAKQTDLGLSSLDLSSSSNAQAALDLVDTAISSLSSTRGNIGAYMNRLGYAAANLATTIENQQAAESVIRDVDMAAEMTDFTKNQILLQAGTAMLAQANMAPQQVLSLFG